MVCSSNILETRASDDLNNTPYNFDNKLPPKYALPKISPPPPPPNLIDKKPSENKPSRTDKPAKKPFGQIQAQGVSEFYGIFCMKHIYSNICNLRAAAERNPEKFTKERPYCNWLGR